MKCINNQGNEASLTIGAIYRSLSTTPLEDKTGMVRIIDNEGEDYLYLRRWFELVPEQALASELSEFVTVHLSGRSKIAIRDIANAKGVSMLATVREWINERLDLPELLQYS